jgi:hypothetical protein
LSLDGAVLTIKSRKFQADGSVKLKERRYKRTSGSVGFAGGWRNVNPLESTPSIWQISLDGDRMHYSFPQEGEHVDAVLDGTDAAVRGPALERAPRLLSESAVHERLN